MAKPKNTASRKQVGEAPVGQRIHTHYSDRAKRREQAHDERERREAPFHRAKAALKPFICEGEVIDGVRTPPPIGVLHLNFPALIEIPVPELEAMIKEAGRALKVFPGIEVLGKFRLPDEGIGIEVAYQILFKAIEGEPIRRDLTTALNKLEPLGEREDFGESVIALWVLFRQIDRYLTSEGWYPPSRQSETVRTIPSGEARPKDPPSVSKAPGTALQGKRGETEATRVPEPCTDAVNHSAETLEIFEHRQECRYRGQTHELRHTFMTGLMVLAKADGRRLTEAEINDRAVRKYKMRVPRFGRMTRPDGFPDIIDVGQRNGGGFKLKCSAVIYESEHEG